MRLPLLLLVALACAATAVSACKTQQRIQVVETGIDEFLTNDIKDIRLSQNITITIAIATDPVLVTAGTKVCYGPTACRGFLQILHTFVTGFTATYTDLDNSSTVRINGTAQFGLGVGLLNVLAMGYYDVDDACDIDSARLQHRQRRQHL